MHSSLKSYRKKSTVQTIATIILAFITAHVFTFIEIFLYMASGYCLVSFHFTLQDSIEHFLQGRSSGHKLVELLLARNVLISPWSLKNSFARYKIHWLFFFVSFSTLNILADFPLASKFSDEKSAENLIGDPHMWWLTSLLLLSRYSVFQKFVYNVF